MQRTTRVRHFGVLVMLTTLLCAGTAWAAPHPAPYGDDDSGKTFLQSDDYKDKGTIKGVFLKDAEYAKMTEDFTRNDAEFDWGWIDPSFKTGNYKTARIELKDDYGVLQPAFNEMLKTTFEAAAKHFGWRIVNSGAADITLGIDIVGYDADSHFAWVTTIQPSVELEIRLRDKHGKDVYLVRNREHSATPAAAAREIAHDMMQQLR